MTIYLIQKDYFFFFFFFLPIELNLIERVNYVYMFLVQFGSFIISKNLNTYGIV